MTLKNKNILIVGFTKRTSFAAAKVLLEMGNRLYISDIKDNEEKRELLSRFQPQRSVVNLLGRQSPDILMKNKFDMILPSPGVPLNIPLIKRAKKMNIEVIGDVELFYRFFPDNTYIAITGTDGKTTTTTLIYEIVKKEKNTVVGGNIGVPIFDRFHVINKDTVIVMELSSFQLEEIEEFCPNIAAILNIADDHLDRYDSIDDYIKAKKRIFMNQTETDTAILNLDSPYFDQLKTGVTSRMQTFSARSEKSDIYYSNGVIYYKGGKYFDRSGIKLIGAHNVENALAAILAAKSIGISDLTIREVLAGFKGLPHRLEFVREIRGTDIYNDSKSTTVNSLKMALLSFDKPIILIAGGKDKGLDFTAIRKLVHRKVKRLILIGEAAEKLRNALGYEDAIFCESLEEAADSSIRFANNGDVILLSPGCASFDMFKNFEHRGDIFKEIVNNY